MALKKLKPTSPGTRFQLRPDRSHLHKGKPHAALVVSQKLTGGRNSSGRLTTRHKGGGHKHAYRIVDLRRDKSTVGMSFVLALVFGFGAGYWLDGRWGTRPWLSFLGFFLGLAAGVLNVYRVMRETSGPAPGDGRPGSDRGPEPPRV